MRSAHRRMLALGSAICTAAAAVVAMGVGMSLFVKMVVGMGMLVAVFVRVAMGVGMGNTVVGVLVGVLVGMAVLLRTAGNMIGMDVHDSTSLGFFLYYTCRGPVCQSISFPGNIPREGLRKKRKASIIRKI